MRELKFRAFDKKQKKMLYGVSIGTIKVWDENAPLISHEFSYSEDCIFEQYTGLKDNNGKEIYEGDILRLTREVARDKSTLYQVVWNEPMAEFDTKNLDEKRWDIGYLNETAAKKDYEVIGNIHENPELLKGEE